MNKGGFKMQTVLELKAVTKKFNGQTILNPIDLTIQQNDFIAVIGKSGSGKSTLLRMIAGLSAPSSGSIWQNQQRVTTTNAMTRIMFQNPRLLPWKTVAQNLSIGQAKITSEQLATTLAQVDLTANQHQYPLTLSGGQQQRVALARILLHHPELLLLDEPFGALDAFTRQSMQQLIENLWKAQQLTALLVTHDIEEAVALASKIVIVGQQQLLQEIPINLPRPRDRHSPAFKAIVQQIISQLETSQVQPAG